MSYINDNQFHLFLKERLEDLKSKRLAKDKHTSNRKHDTLLHILENHMDYISVSGPWLEFGVFKGESINLISRYTHNTVYGFDSFEGFPDDGRTDWEDDFNVKGNLPRVNDNVVLLKGWFEETIMSFNKRSSEQIAFLHVDCDIYSSTKTIFTLLGDRILPGTVIIFDELLHYNGFENNEIKAFYEFLIEKNLDFDWLLIRDKVMSLEDYQTGRTADWKDFKTWRNNGYEQEVAVVIR